MRSARRSSPGCRAADQAASQRSGAAAPQLRGCRLTAPSRTREVDRTEAGGTGPPRRVTESGSEDSFEEGTRDDDALDLVCSFVNLRDLGVTHHPLDRVVGDVSVTAQDLHAVGGPFHLLLRGEVLGHPRDFGQTCSPRVQFWACHVTDLPPPFPPHPPPPHLASVS